MNVKDFSEKLQMTVLAGGDGLENEIKGGYMCDLLSYVMGQAKEGDVWVTVQTNPNIVAVSTLTNIACIVIPENIEVESNTLKKADDNDIPILSSGLTAFEIAYKLKELL